MVVANPFMNVGLGLGYFCDKKGNNVTKPHW